MYKIYQLFQSLSPEAMERLLKVIDWLVEREKRKCTPEEWAEVERIAGEQADAFLYEVDLDYNPNDPDFLRELNKRK